LKTGLKVIRFIEKYCVVPEGTLVGKPFKLAPFQKRFIRDVYDNPAGTNYAHLSIGRKNGKTGLIAALVLAHIDGPVAQQNSHILSGARSRDQASFVFRLASKMVQLSPVLRDRIKIIPSTKKLVGLAMNTEYQAISAEAKTALGNSPVLAILDEVGQVLGPQDDFVDAVTTAQGAYDNPLLISISTQSPNDGDLFSIWLDDAQTSDDPHTIVHLYAAEPDADVMDPKAWKAANPALGLFRSREDLKRQAEKASRMPSAENTFRNLILNQRVSTFSPFVSRNVWEANSGEPLPMEGRTVYGGLDLSARKDLTALVLIFEEDGKKHVHPFFWVPEEGIVERSKRDRVSYDVWAKQGFLRTTPGNTVDYSFVVRDIAEILSVCDVESIRFDRWRIDLLRKEAEREGLEFPLVPFGQGFKDMSPALDSLEEDLLNSNILHGGHPVLQMCAANSVVVTDTAENRKLNKQKAIGRIDGMVALTMSYGAFDTYNDEPEAEFSVLAAIG
jgi:phage terminase large subunit-like protein